MKTTAFLTRVAICAILSLIPVSEFENILYSARMQARPSPFATPQIVLLTVNSEELQTPSAFRAFQSEIKKRGAISALRISSKQLSREGCLVIDGDGSVRRADLFVRGEPSTAFQAFARLGRSTAQLQGIAEPHLINYLGPSGTIPKCSYQNFEARKCPSMAGKWVLITEDDSSTLYTPFGEMSYAEVIANDVETIVNSRVIFQVPFLICIFVITGLVIIGAFYIIYYPVLVSAFSLIITGVIVVILFFQIVFQFWNVYVPSANIIISLFITYLIFTGYRLVMQENLQWRSLKQAQYMKELDHMKTNFLTLVSHDLKTPIAKIQAVVEKMRRELSLVDSRSDWGEMIDSIENSNQEMRAYITSIINLSKLESQKVILNKKSNDINLLIQQALKRLMHFAQQKNIEIEEQLDPLFSIECDEDLMRQVLTNLIDNAIKYSPPHSKVIVRSREEEGFVRVEVEDFGPGIAKDQLPLMFRKFSRILRPMQEKVKGTGLGLYLSKYFIELHGGSIRVKSVEGKGTVFSFTLPLNGIEGETILG